MVKLTSFRDFWPLQRKCLNWGNWIFRTFCTLSPWKWLKSNVTNSIWRMYMNSYHFPFFLLPPEKQFFISLEFHILKHVIFLFKITLSEASYEHSLVKRIFALHSDTDWFWRSCSKTTITPLDFRFWWRHYANWRTTLHIICPPVFKSPGTA